MKRILFLLITALMLLPSLGLAQQEMGDVGPISSFPVVYNYDEQVTWYFDLSPTSFVMGQDLYLWIWSPSEPDAGNWENSSEFAKLTYVSGMTWSFTLTPTVYFSKTPAEIAASAGFWFRIKDHDGTQQSGVGNVAYTDFSSFYTANELVRPYPEHPALDKGLSILFNANVAANSDAFLNAVSVHMHSGLNNWAILQEFQVWLPEIVEKTKLKNLGNGFFKMDLIPKEYFNTPDGFVMENMNYLFVAYNGSDWAGTIPDQILYAAEVVPPPPPAFKFFPSQISRRDFLGMSRTNNEPGINALHYVITAPNSPLQVNGSFGGNMAEIKGFVDLVTPLSNLPNVTEIHVTVTDNANHVISDTDIPLKTLD